jgi:hypothetical protein
MQEEIKGIVNNMALPSESKGERKKGQKDAATMNQLSELPSILSPSQPNSNVRGK